MDTGRANTATCRKGNLRVKMCSWCPIARLAVAIFVGLAISLPSRVGAAATAPLSVRQLAPDFKVVQVSKDVYAFVSGNTTHLVQDGNTTVIVTSEGVVVVDAPSTYLSRRHLAEIRRITKQPVRYLINTHWHADHVFGNHVYKAAFPGVKIVANNYTARISDTRNPAILANFYKGKRAKDMLRDLKTQAEKGVDEEGRPLTNTYDRERAQRSYQEFVPAYEAELQGKYAAPDLTFDGEMVIKLGGKKIVVKTMVGHSKSDTIVYLPDERLVVTGDLLIAPVPYGINPFFDDWMETLDQLIAMPVDAYVPGHGDVEYSRTYLHLLRNLLASLMKQAEEAARRGMTLEEFKRALDLKEFEAKLVGKDPELKWGWDNYFMDGAPERAFAISKGDM